MKFSRFLQIIIIVLVFPSVGLSQAVEWKNHSFYINGQKFFVKGIGYEAGAIPGKLPWARTFDAGLLQFDMQRILAGGFNTIRTWAPLTEPELNVLQQYNIKVIMGIWIDPQGNFADEAFVNQSKKIVTDVLSYSKNYNNIIAYLIMNEPLPEKIAAAGYQQTVSLWKQLTDIIHAQHPNRPVSIANSSNGTYISPDIFDFSAYNVYIYNPVTVNYLHGYRDFVQYLNQLNKFSSPLIITEYGLSVSPTGPGNWGYGGNSLTAQKDGDLYMYKSLVDGGAAGSCVFNYSDGWWKSGNEFAHDDNPEEWFGLVNYTSLADKYGQQRPAWEAIKAYQSAIITQPRSAEIYPEKVPVEVFFNDTVKRLEIVQDTVILFKGPVEKNYLADTLQFDVPELKDAILVFNCYDAANNLVKSEEKNILITAKDIILPSIQISIANGDYWQNGYVDVNYKVTKSAPFAASSRLDYVFYPHVGFNYGDKFQRTLPVDEQFSFTSHHAFTANVNVFTVGAAFDITYNNFRKRIVNQLTLSRINDVTNSIAEHASLPVRIYPNPVNDFFKVMKENTISTPCFDYTITDNLGVVVKRAQKVGWDEPVYVKDLIPGIYFLRVALSDQVVAATQKIIKL